MSDQIKPDPQTKWGHIHELDRSFDLEYWQKQSSEARMKAVSKMVEDYLISRGEKHALRIQRDVVTFGVRRR